MSIWHLCSFQLLYFLILLLRLLGQLSLQLLLSLFLFSLLLKFLHLFLSLFGFILVEVLLGFTLHETLKLALSFGWVVLICILGLFLHLFHLFCGLHQLLMGLFDLLIVLLPGHIQSFLEFVDVIELLLTHIHLLISSSQYLIHLILLPLYFLKGSTSSHHIRRHLRLHQALPLLLCATHLHQLRRIISVFTDVTEGISGYSLGLE